MNRRKVAVVLGAGRSGTSAVAKGLHLAGFPMGDKLVGPHKSNPWGHWEDSRLVTLNDVLLESLGGTWNDPPPEPDPLDEANHGLIEACCNYIDSRGPGQFGMKDPRLVPLWPIWREAFARFDDIEPIVVQVWRHPETTTDSFVARDGTDPAVARALVDDYQQRMRRELW